MIVSDAASVIASLPICSPYAVAKAVDAGGSSCAGREDSSMPISAALLAAQASTTCHETLPNNAAEITATSCEGVRGRSRCGGTQHTEKEGSKEELKAPAAIGTGTCAAFKCQHVKQTSCCLQPAAYQQTVKNSFALGGLGLHTGEYGILLLQQ